MKWFPISVPCMKKLFKIVILVIIVSVLLCNMYMSIWRSKYTIVPRLERVRDNQSPKNGPALFMLYTSNISYGETQTPTEVMQTPKKEVQTSKEVVHMPKEEGQTPKEVLQTQQEEIQASKEVLQMPKEEVQTPQKRSTVTDTLAEIYRNISEFFILSNSDPLDPLLNLHQFNYLINSDKCQQNVFVLIFVHSSSDKWLQRNQIRTTWGGYKGSNRNYFRTVFMLGKPMKGTLQPAIIQESMKYNDMVQGDFDDTYKHLTYKHIMAYSWITENCPNVSYIVKVDDDIMVNVYNMVNYFNKTKPMNNWIYCYALRNQGPHRSKKSKWAMSKSEYPFTRYPQFCEGFAYITTPPVAAKLVKVSRNAKFFWIDDVFVTGILTLRAKVPLTSMVVNHGHGSMQKLYTGPSVKNVTFIVVRTANNRKYWNSTWQAILNYSRV